VTKLHLETVILSACLTSTFLVHDRRQKQMHILLTEGKRYSWNATVEDSCRSSNCRHKLIHKEEVFSDRVGLTSIEESADACQKHLIQEQ
jgi:hypothetical protein